MNDTAERVSLLNKPFVLLCVAMFLGYANQWAITPVIPLYVNDLGGSAFVAGLALLAFSVPSFLVRPIVGRIADRWNAAGVMACGVILLAAGSLLYLAPLLAAVVAGGVVRGLGWGALNIGGYTTLATTAPPQRRGEASGYYSGISTSATVAFPALALWLLDGHGGFDAVFLLSTAAALAGLPIALHLARNQKDAKHATPAAASPGSFFDRGVLVAMGLNLCSMLIAPSVMAFLPLYARSLGIDNIGLFYLIAGITSIFVRPVLGKKSDAMGRGPAIAIGLVAQLIGLALIFAAQGLALILVGGFFVSVGWAMIGAITAALAMDLTDPGNRGRGMATYSLSFQLGSGVGAVVSGALADLVGLRGMYAGSMVMTLAGLALLAGAWKRMPRPHRGRDS